MKTFSRNGLAAAWPTLLIGFMLLVGNCTTDARPAGGQDLALLQSAKAGDAEKVQSAIEIGAPFPEDLRTQFLMECIGRGAQRGDDLYYVTSFCTCTFDAMRRGMTVDEYKEMESLQRAGKNV